MPNGHSEVTEIPSNQCRRRESKPSPDAQPCETLSGDADERAVQEHASARPHVAPRSVDHDVDHGPGDDVSRLTTALVQATTAGEWALAKMLAAQLERIELARAGNVVPLRARK